METPLSGRRIALTRTEEDARSLAEKLRSRGAEVLVHPAIRRVPPRDVEALRKAVARLRRGDYDGVLFTSPAAVGALQGEWGKAPLPVEIVGAVGPATRAALGPWSWGEVVVAPRHDGASLAEALAMRLGDRLSGMRFLQPRAEEGREELRRGLEVAGARVDVVAAYRTEAVAAEELRDLVARLQREDLDAVVFASPSAVAAVAAACGGTLAGLGSAYCVAIGRTTAEALRRAGAARVQTAAAATDEALVEAVERCLGAPSSPAPGTYTP